MAEVTEIYHARCLKFPNAEYLAPKPRLNVGILQDTVEKLLAESLQRNK